MVSRMFRPCLQLEILRSVIGLVFVSVVYDFIAAKKTSELVLHSHAMKRVKAVAICTRMCRVSSAITVTSALTNRQDFEWR